MDGISLLVGLGNPGERYARTRHNAGFWFLDALAAATGAELRPQERFHADVGRCDLAGRRVWLLAPTTFMNLSGDAVAAFAHYHRIASSRILVVHDDIDLSPGVARLKQGGGHGGHKGLMDISRKLGTGDFVRLRLGVGHPGHADDVVAYVLRPPSAAEQESIDAAIKRALAQLPEIVLGNHERVMNVLHRRAQTHSQTSPGETPPTPQDGESS